MARQESIEITCDLPGCRKTPGNAANPHIVVNLQWLAPNPDGDLVAIAPDVPEITGIGQDFCSVEHAVEWMKGLDNADLARREQALRTPPEPEPDADAGEPEADEPEDGE